MREGILSEWHAAIFGFVTTFLVGGSLRSVIVIAISLASMQSIGRHFASRLEGELGGFVRSCLGFLFVITLVVEVNQQLIRWFKMSLPWWSLPIVSLLVAQLSSNRSIPQNFRKTELGDQPIVIYGTSILMCSFTYYWFAPLALAVLTPVVFQIRRVSPAMKIVSLTGIIAALLTLAIAIKPRYWSLIAEEQVFYALISNSLAHFPSSIFSFSDTGGINYHWLTYGLTGWLGREAQFDLIPLMSLLLPILFTALAIGLVVSLLNIQSLTRRKQLVAILILCFFLYPIGPWGGAKALEWHISPSQPASLAFGLGLLLLITASSRVTPINLLFIGLCSYGAIGSYVSTSIAPIVGAAVALAISAFPGFPRSSRIKSCIFGCVIVTSAIFSLYRYFHIPLTNSDGQARLSLSPFLGFIEVWDGEISSLAGRELIMAKVGFIIGVSMPLIMTVIVSFGCYTNSLSRGIRAIAISGIIGALVIQSDYFAAQFVILTSVYVIAVPYLAIGYLGSVARQAYTYLALLWGLGSWLLWYFAVDAIKHRGGVQGVIYRYYLQASPVVVVCLYCSVAFFATVVARGKYRRFRLNTNDYQKILRQAVGALLVFSCLQGFYGYKEGFAYFNWRYETRGELLRPSASTLEAARWMTTNSTQDDLYAVDGAEADLDLQNLFMLSGRRLLIPGPILWERDFRDEPGGPRLLEIQKRLHQPTPSLIPELRGFGVTHILLRERESREQFLKQFGEPSFHNNVWAVYPIAGMEVGASAVFCKDSCV